MKEFMAAVGYTEILLTKPVDLKIVTTTTIGFIIVAFIFRRNGKKIVFRKKTSECEYFLLKSENFLHEE